MTGVGLLRLDIEANSCAKLCQPQKIDPNCATLHQNVFGSGREQQADSFSEKEYNHSRYAPHVTAPPAEFVVIFALLTHGLLSASGK